MSRDVLTVGSTMRIQLLYRGEYSQWVERFINYLEEQTNGEAMINSIKNDDQPLPRVTQVSISKTSLIEQHPLKDKSMWSDQEKRIQKIDRLARSLLIQGLLNDIYSLIDSNKTTKDLWDALARHMLGSEYGEQDRKAAVLYEYETFKSTKEELLLDTYIRYLQKQYATMMRQKKNLMDINVDALYNILKQNQRDVNDAMGPKKKTVVVTSDPLALITEKTKVCKSKEKVVVSSDSEGSDADDFSELKKITALLAKSFNRRKFYSKLTNNNLRISSASQSANKKQEFVNDSDQEINANMVFMAQIEKVLSDSEATSSCADEKISEVSYYLSESESDNSTNYGLFVNNDDDQEIFHDAIESASENFIDNHIDSQKDYDKSDVDHNDFEQKDYLVDKLIRKFNKKIVKCQKPTTFEMNNKELNEQLKELIEKNKDLLAQTKLLKEQLQVKHVVIDTHAECQEKYAKLKAERYEYMIRYSAYFDNDKQHMKQIANLEVLYDKMSVQLVELDKHFKRSRENTIEFAYDYGNLNASYVNEKINFEDDYFQEIINPYFEKIDSPFQQTSSLKPYVPNVIIEKIIIDLEDKVVNLLEKEKKKWSSNTFNVDLSAVSVSNLNKNVKRYSRKDLLACNNSYLRETSSAYVCNDAMNVSCNPRLCDMLDDNNFFIFDDVNVKISPVSKMHFRKKPRDSMHVRFKNNMIKYLPRTVHKWLPKLQPSAEPVAKWFPRVERQIDCSDLSLDHRFGMFKAYDG
nr:hypothetical protein [Tanacetum cinerariifolium]